MPTWFRTWVLPTLALLFAAGAAVLGALIQGDGDKIRWWAVVGAAGCTLSAGLLAILERRASDQVASELVAEQSDVRVAVNDLLEPLMQELGRALAAAGSERARLLERLVPMCLSAAANLLGGRRARASFFRLTVKADGTYEARPDQSQGRAGQPRTVFRSNDPVGRRLFDKLISDPGYDFCSDVVKDPPLGLTIRDHGYATYLAVFARNGDEVAGVVTVDSPQPGDLAPEDRHFLNLIATIIAIAVHMAEKGHHPGMNRLPAVPR